LPPGQRAKVRDQAAKAVGVSGRTADKLTTVVKAARKDPDAYGLVMADMDRTGKVDRAYRTVAGNGKAADKTPARASSSSSITHPPAIPYSVPKPVIKKLRMVLAAVTAIARQPATRGAVANFFSEVARWINAGAPRPRRRRPKEARP
jgi:hypothetical protein